MAATTDIVVKVIDETRAGLASISNGLSSLKDRADGVSSNLKTIIASYATIETAKAFVNQINQVQEYEAKLKLVTKTQSEFNDAYQTVYDISQKTRQPIKEVTDLYTKMARSQDLLGISGKEVATVTEAFNIALQRSGATGPSAAGAITQFAQALQSGKFQGDEFRSISETIPEILDIISKSSGIAREDLKKYASDGLLTGKIAAIALIDAHDQLQLGNKTLAQSFTQLQNKLSDSVKGFLDSSGAGETLIKVVDHITNNFDSLVPILKVAGLALAALAVYVAPVAAGFLAVTTAVVFFAKELEPIANLILRIVVPPIKMLIETVAGLAAGLVAIASGDFANVFKRMDQAVASVQGSFNGADKAAGNLSDTTKELGQETGKTTEVSQRMKDALEEAKQKALEGKTAYANLVTQLKYNTQASEEDAAVKKYQTELYKFFEAKSKDLKIAVGDLSAEQQKAIEAEVGGLIKSKLANDEALKAREKLYNDSVSYLKKYGDDYDKFANENLTATNTFENQKAKLNEQYNIANEYASKNNKEALTQIDEDFRKAMLFLQLKGITDLAKDYKKYSDDARSDSQKLADELTKIDEARRIAGIDGESKYQEALQGLRDKFAAKYKTLVESSANFGLTREQQLQQDLAKLDAEAKAVGYTRQDDYEKQRQALIFKSYEDIYKRGQKFIDDNLSNEALYNKNLAELELARASSSQENQKYVNAALLALNKDYIDKTVSTYPELYKAYSDSLMKMLGVSNENVGKMKEVFKLFGYDVDAILKDLFVQGIRYLLGFTNSANQNINSVQGVMNQVFGSNGTATGSISSFVDGATSLFSGFGSTISSIFSGIGSWFGEFFGGGGGILTTALAAIKSFASSATSAVSSVVSSVSSAVGITGGSTAATISGGSTAAAAGGSTAAASGSSAVTGGTAAALAGTAAFILGAGKFVEMIAPDFGKSIDQLLKENNAKQQAIDSQKSNEKAIITKLISDLKSKYSLSTDAQGNLRLQDRSDPKFGKYNPATNDNDLAANILQGRTIKPNVYTNPTFQSEVFNEYKNRAGSPYSDFAYGQSNYISTAQDALWLYLATGSKKYGAKGLAYNMGNLISAPTAYGTRSGIAIGGEMGTEAIMPLKRGPDGRLGVSSDGASGVNINFTINAVDARGIDQLLVERQTLITNIVRRAVNSRSGSGVTI